VSVEYGVDAQACKAAILELVNADSRVLKEDTDLEQLYKELQIKNYQLSTVSYRLEAIPAPFVAMKSLNPSDITFVVRAWVRGDDYWGVFFDLQEQFYTELPKRGFGFAYPHIVLKDKS
jgi:small conductance mechanosensitive channel